MATVKISVESGANSGGIEQAVKGISDLDKDVKAIVGTLALASTGFKGTGQSAQQAGQAASSSAANIKQLSSALAEARLKSQEASIEVDKLSQELAKAKAAENQDEAAIKQLSSALNNAKSSYKETQTAVKELNLEYGRAKQAAKDAGDGQDDVRSKLGQLVESLKKGREGFDKFKEGTLGAKEGGEKAGGAMQALNAVGPLVAKGVEIAADALKDLGKEGLKAALDLDQSTRTIKAQLGATTAEAKKLGDTARAVFRSGFTESITEASQQIVKVKQAFKDVGDSITQQNIAEKANGIAKAFGVEFNDVIKAASTASKNFGISSSQALDLVAVAFQKTGDLSGDLLDTINEYSPQFARAGQSADQFIGSLVAGSQAGAFNLDKVADAVKEFTIRIQDGSTTTQQGLSILGISYADLSAKIGSGQLTIAQAQQLVIEKLNAQKSSVQQNIAGVDLFGTQWEDVGSKVILALNNGNTALGKFQGTAKQVTDDINSGLGASFEKLKNSALDSFASSLTKSAGGTEKLAQTLDQLSGVVSTAVAVIGGFIGGTLDLLNTTIKIIGDTAREAGNAIRFLTGQPLEQASAGTVKFSAAAGDAASKSKGAIDAVKGLTTSTEQLGKQTATTAQKTSAMGTAIATIGPDLTRVKAATDALKTSQASLNEAQNAAQRAGAALSTANLAAQLSTAAANTEAQKYLATVSEFNRAKIFNENLQAGLTQQSDSLKQAEFNLKDLEIALEEAQLSPNPDTTKIEDLTKKIDLSKIAIEKQQNSLDRNTLSVEQQGRGLDALGRAKDAEAEKNTRFQTAQQQAAAGFQTAQQQYEAAQAGVITATNNVAAAQTAYTTATTTMVQQTGQQLGTLQATAQTGFGGVTQAAQTGATGVATAVSSGMAQANQAVVGGTDQIGASLVQGIQKAIDGLNGTFSAVGGQIAGAIRAGDQDIVNAVDGIGNLIAGQAQKLYDQAGEIGRATLSSLATGFGDLKSIDSQINQTLKELVVLVKGNIQKSGTTLGTGFGDGVAAGIKASTPKVLSEAQKLADAIRKVASGEISRDGAPTARAGNNVDGPLGLATRVGPKPLGGGFGPPIGTDGSRVTRGGGFSATTNVVLNGKIIATAVQDEQGKQLKAAIGAGVFA